MINITAQKNSDHSGGVEKHRICFLLIVSLFTNTVVPAKD